MSPGPLSMGVREQLAEDLQHAKQTWTKTHHRHPFDARQQVYIDLIEGEEGYVVDSYQYCEGGQEIGAGAIAMELELF